MEGTKGSAGRAPFRRQGPRSAFGAQPGRPDPLGQLNTVEAVGVPEKKPSPTEEQGPGAPRDLRVHEPTLQSISSADPPIY